MDYVAELRPGDRIPAERVLVRQLGVSRSSMREALRVLSSLGLLEVREGRGTFVAHDDGPLLEQALMASAIVGGQTARELHEVRAHIEPFAARLAATRASDEQLARIARSLEEQAAALDSVDTFLEADVAFHLAIADAADNRFLVGLLRTVRALMMARMATLFATRQDMVPRLGEHRTIYEAISRRDPAVAEVAMAKHMHAFSHLIPLDDFGQ